ncbi:histamine H3 receptor-like [Ruditapes philippinarum]|uniref:histamine H3 receptor-like n=1 Tax=Ruditapes philippinarum TaxID=129788 RepID=UPI00295ADCFA|nr:histamine H3 receptor-like [Ruditapes philippinarum]
MTTEDYDDYDESIIPMTSAVQIPSGLGLSLLIIIGISGNVLTLVAFFKNRQSATVYDFFIVNLAFTDLMLCCSSMTFYAVYTLMEFTWPFGYAFCKVWLVLDFTLCFESILLMLILSLDRLLMVSMGPAYTQRVTKTVALVQISISWLVSFLVYGPAIIGWNHWVGYSTVEEKDCDAEFAYDQIFTTATSIVEFVLPFFGLTLLNSILYLKIRRRMKVKPAQTYQVVIQTLDTNPGSCSDQDKSKEDSLKTCKIKQYSPGFEPKEGVVNNPHSNCKDVKQNQRKNDDSYEKRKNTTEIVQRSVSNSRKNSHDRAAKFLASLVVAFLLFWAPYSITTMVISFCGDCVNTSLYEFFNWLLWMKSAVNPFLYAFNSLRYRKAFLKYLTFNGRICKNKIGIEQPTASRSVY